MFAYRSRREQLVVAALVGLFLLAMGYIGAGRMRAEAPISIQSVPYRKGAPSSNLSSVAGPSSMAEPGLASGPSSTHDRTGDTSSVPAEIVVDVVGAVKHPGLRHLPSDARAADAVTASGGPTDNANLDAFNLAAKLQDGEMVRVPRRGEGAAAMVGGPPSLGGSISDGSPSLGAPARSSRGGRSKLPTEQVDLNSATAEQLESLPGVGPATAEKIIEYRSAHGAFTSVEELSAIPRLGPKKLAQILPYVRI